MKIAERGYGSRITVLKPTVQDLFVAGERSEQTEDIAHVSLSQ